MIDFFSEKFEWFFELPGILRAIIFLVIFMLITRFESFRVVFTVLIFIILSFLTLSLILLVFLLLGAWDPKSLTSPHPAIAGIIALYISYKTVKYINKTNYFNKLFNNE